METQSHKKGFTLIEVIVSIALFAVILTIALGALLMIIDANRQAKAIKLVVNNLNLAMEGMSRELRVGSEICDTLGGSGLGCNNSSGANEIYFTTDRGEADSLFRHNQNGSDPGSVMRRIGPDAPDNQLLKLTGSDVIVDNLVFYIRGVGVEGGTQLQPSVVIVINGHIRQGDEVVTFNVQTVVSQRKLDL